MHTPPGPATLFPGVVPVTAYVLTHDRALVLEMARSLMARVVPRSADTRVAA